MNLPLELMKPEIANWISKWKSNKRYLEIKYLNLQVNSQKYQELKVYNIANPQKWSLYLVFIEN